MSKHCFDTSFVFNYIQFMLINKHLQRTSLKSKTYHSLYTLLNQPGQDFHLKYVKPKDLTQKNCPKFVISGWLININQPEP